MRQELILARAEEEKERLSRLCQDIHTHPETGFQEYRASAQLTGYLEEHGFTVRRGCAGMDTAFLAEKISGDGPSVGLFCEYDALPGLGHACGHNVIAVTAVGAAVCAAEVLMEHPGRLVVLGTPAEEGGGGGKIRLLEAGLLENLDCGMMLHPGPLTVVKDKTLAISTQRFLFHGRAAHAGAAQEEGRNALEAVIQLFNGINSLRGHLPRDANIHGIIREGGTAPNIIPDRAAAEFSFRAGDRAALDSLLMRARACADGAAAMAGCTVEIGQVGLPYWELVPNDTLQNVVARALEETGITIDIWAAAEGFASTDLGNVSQVLPAVQLMLGVGTPVLPHTPAFARACSGAEGAALAMKGVRALGLSAARLLAQPRLVAEARRELAGALRNNAAVGQSGETPGHGVAAGPWASGAGLSAHS